MKRLALLGVAVLALGLYLNGPRHISVAKADQVSALRQQLLRERHKHKLDRARIARELHRLHKMVQKYKINFDRSGIGYVSPRESAWMCIHSKEGAWNDHGAPYWGGLQMDMSFQRAYGPEFVAKYGTADNWPYRVQIMVADRAYQSRGFGPWPNTARACGLL